MRKTCRHFRYRIPREDADELRKGDPLPCEVCDTKFTSSKFDALKFITDSCKYNERLT
jgi:hypothetical protein